ncbi:MAG: hypothetical protein EKK64_00580 [Neisseriaceae bacterium]|nr:MAG: hypothetical protein EKK64_00580 [Neisseriaceae bacterium]
MDDVPEITPEVTANPSAPQIKIKGPTYPIYLFEEGVELPEDERFYLVTKTGIYFNKKTKAGDALVPVDGIPWLMEPDLEMRLKLPKVPARIIAQALTFFRKVYDKYNSEAYVTLMYSSKNNEYQLHCPKQTVSHSSVNYDRTDQPEYQDRVQNDWQMVGTIHSHCNFSAFHSGTDVGDEATFDGIHITLGNVDRNQISIASSVAINEKREELLPEKSCSGVVRAAVADDSKFMSFSRDQYYDIEMSEEDAQQLVLDAEIIENEWMPKVSKQGWQYGGKRSFFQQGGNQQYPNVWTYNNIVEKSTEKNEKNADTNSSQFLGEDFDTYLY